MIRVPNMIAEIRLTDRELDELKRWAATEDSDIALERAKEEFLRFIRRRQLLELPGNVHMDMDWTGGDLENEES